MQKKGKRKISYVLQIMNIFPLLVLGILILLLGTHWFTQAMHAEVETELHNVVSGLITLFDELYPGDYHLEGDVSCQLYKGDTDITDKCALLDKVKAETGLEVTLFYQNTRILTTITGENGVRITGSGAPNTVVTDVLSTGESRFYNKTIIYGKSYFSYYVPLRNQDGSVVGMFFVGKPSQAVDSAIHNVIYPLIFADILLVALVALITSLYTGKIVSSLLQIHSFLKAVAGGNLHAKLSPSVIGRRDEIGEIAHCALYMQHSLHALVEQDALTSLVNRRSGDRQLRQTVSECHSHGIPFCIAIGDIDLFKQVNDTYGHDCGDIVLKSVSDVLRRHMLGKGFVSRWGGEEFLLVFDHTEPEDAHETLEALLEDVCSTKTVYGSHTVSVTMTFGLVPGYCADVKTLLCDADRKLYEGKSSGRNRIIR